MPELPEVETIRRGLEKTCHNQTILDIKVLCEKSAVGEINQAKNAKISFFRRFGKALILDLSNNYSLMIHLRMTGQLIWVPESESDERFAGGHPNDNFLADLPNNQTRVVIYCESGTLFFNDQRKFGFIKALKTETLQEDPFIKKLAPEPWNDSIEAFYKRLQHHKSMNVKAALLDQTIIAGLGNIYADESLWLSQINPSRLVSSISQKDAASLLDSAKTSMEASLNAGGSTIKNYVKSDGTKGDYLDLFANAYGRENQPCNRCQTPMQKIKLAGRGTHFCPNCQK